MEKEKEKIVEIKSDFVALVVVGVMIYLFAFASIEVFMAVVAAVSAVCWCLPDKKKVEDEV